ncbi:fimbrial protein [Rahnella laticis]|uniref:fimbrial protein n=1 Tax=Rahnella laticis TaxID=2787622 RepID=UPI0018A2E39C|nr:fimbrial protein [Rahnella laticis]MBF7997765.1 fimbrial protein [Rahnella laticis]
MTKFFIKHGLFKPAALVMMLMLSQLTLAATSIPSATVKVTVKIQEVPCHVNNNDDINVEFGAVLSSQIDSASKDIPLAITCDNIPAGVVELKIVGDATSFDSTALITDVNNVGIKFYGVGNNSLRLNEAYSVAELSGSKLLPENFNLVARLTKNNDAKIAGGEFNSSATLMLITI